MSGPDYPADPAPGSNAIGLFQIGVSPVGDIPLFNPWTTTIVQYANSPGIDSEIGSLFAALDLTETFDSFFDNYWNVDTAQGIGLDILGRKVGVSRVLELSAGTFFGFEEAAQPQSAGFNQGAPFWTGTTINNNYILADQQYRILILAKAFVNIMPCTIPNLNQLLLGMFPGQYAYVVDNGGMQMHYVFEFTPTPLQLAIIENSGVLPKPDGVHVLYTFGA